MNSMFCIATAFNGDLSGWNVSNVTDMGGMFQDASSYNHSLRNWSISASAKKFEMLKGANSLQKDAWPKLIRHDGDIYQAVEEWCSDPEAAEEKYGHISDWDVSHVT